jgi:hypothetical protein
MKEERWVRHVASVSEKQMKERENLEDKNIDVRIILP